MRPMLALATLLLVTPALVGCLSGPDEAASEARPTAGMWPADADFATTGPDGKPLKHSRTLIAGTYDLLDVAVVNVPSFDGTLLNLGIWRPDVPESTRVPIIIDAGPYYLDGDLGVDQPANRLGGFLIENFVPHGYAVVQASIRGTGLSTGCVDYMGDKEQRDLDAILTYLGEQDWSSGAIGMIGRSYDGSTPWEAATFGNPYLKTIVPISGIHDLGDLHYHNGSAETRSVALGSLYYSYAVTQGGTGGPEEDPRLMARAACVDGPTHAPMAAAGYATGGRSTPVPDAENPYWAIRDFDERVLANYQGSLFYIHGLQDWNVAPNQGAEVYNAFLGEKKALLGQWGHNYPDRPDEHDNLRWDWAEMLLRWFDRELKGLDIDTGPPVIVQDHRGNWRDEPRNAWPPIDAIPLALHPSANGELVTEGAEGATTLYRPAAAAATDQTTPAGDPSATFATAPFEAETRISGQPRLHITVTPSGTGGQLYAELYEAPANGTPILIGRAQMNLHYAEGGKTYRTIGAGENILALMQFYPLDARILEGSKVLLVVTQERGLDPLPAAETAPVTLQYGDDLSTLYLPIIKRTFEPTRWDSDGDIKKETA